MARDYSPLRQHLQALPPDEPVTLSWEQLGQFVHGGLPLSASVRQWWANTTGNTQAGAWMGADRVVKGVKLGVSVTFSPVGVQAVKHTGGNGAKLPKVGDGVKALAAVLERAGYASIVEAVAAHALFLHPATVEQTKGHAVFPVIRGMHRRGQFDKIGAQTVLLDDNTSATQAFLWAARRGPGNDTQTNHIWSDSKNPYIYVALWNLTITPAFLAKCT